MSTGPANWNIHLHHALQLGAGHWTSMAVAGWGRSVMPAHRNRTQSRRTGATALKSIRTDHTGNTAPNRTDSRLRLMRLSHLHNTTHRIIRDLRPAAGFIARQTATATAAYLIALVIPASSGRPVLAPLTALLVLQATVYQTARAGLKKVAAVTAGVLVAVTVAAFVPFTWWLLGLLIAVALIIGRALRLGDDLLEVPISAMLIFSVSRFEVAAAGRVVETLVGTAVGLAGGLIFARLHTQPAREAVRELAWRLAGLLDGMASGLPDDVPDSAAATEWLNQARALRGEIDRVDDALRRAEDSARLNPRTIRRRANELPAQEVALRTGLETLAHSALYLRGLARSIIDSARVTSDASPVRDAATRRRLAGVLSQLGIAIRTYGQLLQTLPAGDSALEDQLEAQLAEAHRQQDELAGLLEPDTGRLGGDVTEWPLRGEILSHVDRLRTSLRVDDISGQHPVRQRGAMRARRPSRPVLPKRVKNRPTASRREPHAKDGAHARRTECRRR